MYATPDFELKTELKSPALRVFEAVTLTIPGWWPYAKTRGDVFSLRTGYSQHTVQVVHNPDQNTVTWLFLDSILFVPDVCNRHEWTGIRLVWHMTGDLDTTTLSLRCFGLDHRSETFRYCECYWHHVLENSLKRYVEAGGDIDDFDDFLYAGKENLIQTFADGIIRWVRILNRL